jgi:transposase InsO family protein
LLESLPETRIKQQGVMSLDDTLLTHYGQAFEQIAYLYDHVQGCYVWAHNLVTVHYSDNETDYPLCFQLWQPPDLAKLEQGLVAAGVKLKESKRALRQEETALRNARRAVREQRRVEDAAWQVLKSEQRSQKNAASDSAPSARKAQDSHWRALRRQRKQTLSKRKELDQAWKQERLAFRQHWSRLPIVTAWIAILVITDNCTRQCLGLPLFVAGPRVTAEMIVDALRYLLPPHLLFVISDRGTHFTADAFQTLMRCAEFIHVLIARHRPQSNGIAERFVRSLKEWLKDKSWQDDQQLAALLNQFLAEYNGRPHQGLPIPGLSPNEFASRIWLL